MGVVGFYALKTHSHCNDYFAEINILHISVILCGDWMFLAGCPSMIVYDMLADEILMGDVCHRITIIL